MDGSLERPVRRSDEAESSAQAALRAASVSQASQPGQGSGNEDGRNSDQDSHHSDNAHASDDEEGTDDANDDDDLSKYAHIEQLATSRAKRSTAGNRMRALLDQEEMEDDEMFVEVEGDIDFREKEDEHDVVDSDFDQESDDEAMEYDEEDQGERELEALEKAQRRQRVARAKAGPAQLKKFGIRQATARPPPSALLDAASSGNLASRPTARPARASAPSAVTTSPFRSAAAVSSTGRVRTSSRKATVRVKLETQSKLREAAERRAAQPTRYLAKKRPRLTQDALIAEALEMEEANRESLRVFLAQEEEKKRARSGTKPTIVGPFIRWSSVRHTETLIPIVQLVGNDTGTDISKDVASYDTLGSGLTEDPAVAARAEAERLRQQRIEQDKLSTVADNRPGMDSSDATTRTYLSLHDLPRGTTWSEELCHIFGDHTDWVDLRIVPSRNRPLRPRRSTCPITGLAANYKDPRTGVPYANKEAFATLTDLLEHRYVWAGASEDQTLREQKQDLGSTNSSNLRQSTPVVASQSIASADSIGFYAGREDDPGAGGLLNSIREQLKDSNSTQQTSRVTTTAPIPTTPLFTAGPVSQLSGGTAGNAGRSVVTASQPAPIIISSVAPGDEKVLIEAALALPSGTTRSGAKRAIPSSTASSTAGKGGPPSSSKSR